VTVTGEDNSLGTDPLEPPLMAPLLRDLPWAQVQRMSQSAAYRDDPMLRRIRATGPRSRHLLEGLPGVSPDREFVPCTDAPSARLVGRINQHEYEAVADPPEEFRVRALTRAARYPVSTLSRRAERATWRGVPCWVLQRDDRWARMRVIRPDGDSLAATGARCYERGVYESWAPLAELVDHHVGDIPYEL